MKINVYMSGKSIENFKNFQRVEAFNKYFDHSFLIEINLEEVCVQCISDSSLWLQRYDTK